jgi:hypothetical protein
MALALRALRFGVVAMLCFLGLGTTALSDSTWAGGATVTTTHPTSKADDLAPFVLSSLGSTYAVVTQGPLVASDFASYSPNPRAAAVALHELSTETGFRTYLRAWSSSNAKNGVIDLVIRFPSEAAATRYLAAQRKSMRTTPYVRRAALTSIPGATRFSYLVDQPQAGVGQLIDFARGQYVSTLTFNSATNPRNVLISSRWASAKALAQFRLLESAPGPSAPPTNSHGGHPVVAWTALGLAVLGMVGLGLVALRMRRLRTSPAGAMSDGQETSAAN